MDPGADIAARQLAAVADVLLPWLRKDADSDSPALSALLAAPDSHSLDIAASFGNGDELKPALRALLARAEAARTAAQLATASKDVCARCGDLAGSAGAARRAHAAALRNVVRTVGAAGASVRADAAVCTRLLELCSRDSEVALDDVEEEALDEPMAGMHFASPLMRAAAEEESERVRGSAELPARGSAEAWTELADDVEAYWRFNPEMTKAQQTLTAALGHPVGGAPAERALYAGLLSEFPDAHDVDPVLLDVLRLPDDA